MKRSVGIVLIILMSWVIVLSGCSKSPEEKRAAYLESAAEYVQKGKYAEAAIQYQNALKIAPDDAKTLVALGEANLKLMKAPEAYKAFAAAAKADPKNTKAHEYLALILTLAKQYDKAEKEASAILAYEPNNKGAKELRAQALYSTGKQSEAVGIMEGLLKDPKPTESVFTNAAYMYMGMKRTDEAVSVVTRGASLYPGSAKIRFLASDIYASKGDQDLSRKWAEEAYVSGKKDLNSGLTLARFYAARRMDEPFFALLAELKTKFPKNASPYLLESGYQRSKGDLDKALALAEQARALDDNAMNKTHVAQLLLEKKDRPKAEKLLKEAIEKDPKTVPARVLLTQLYLKDRNPQKALETLDVLMKNLPERPEVATEAAQAYLMKGDLTKARESVERALKEHKNSVLLHSMLVKVDFAGGKFKEVLSGMETLGRTAFVQPDVLYIGALSAFKLNQKDKAALYTDGLKKISPDSWQSLHTQSLMAFAKGDRKGALQAAEKAVDLYPQIPQALALYAGIAPSVMPKEDVIRKVSSVCGKNNTVSCHMILARLLETSGNVDGALAQLKEAIKLNSTDATLYHVLAQFYLSHNMTKKAMDEYEALVNKNPNDIKAALMLAQINQSQGKIADARKVYSYVIEREPKNILAANNLSWILADSGKPADLSEALRLAQIAKERFPDDPRIADTLGYVYLKKGLAENAIGQFQLALEKMPQEPTINYHMALALVQLSRNPEARKYLEVSLGTKNPFPEKSQALKLMATLATKK